MKRNPIIPILLIVTAVLIAVFFVWCLVAINQIENEDNEATGAILGWVLFLATGIHLSWPIAAAIMLVLGILLLVAKKVVTQKRMYLALWIICLALVIPCLISAMATIALGEYIHLIATAQVILCVLYAVSTVTCFVAWAKLRKIKPSEQPTENTTAN